VIEEVDDRTPQRSDMLTDFRFALAATDHELRVLDDDLKDASGKTPDYLQPYLDRAGTDRPVMFVIDKATGTVLSQIQLPATADGAMEEVTK